MHAELPFTILLNRLLAGPVTALLHALGIQVHDPARPIPDFVAVQILVVILLILFFIVVRSRLSVDQPSALQHVLEGIHGFVNGQANEIIGHGAEKYTGYLIALGMYILSCNLIGLIPSLESPTAFPSVPLGCALVTWFYYHVQGLRANGLGYFKHFAGPVWWLAPLMFPIEVFSHLARIMSLTIRLFANMFAGDMVTLVFFSLVPLGVPLIFMGLHLGVSFIQTYIFVLLAMVYLAEATAHEH
ncbi:MAG TPA: F0F1 ATP synthase subunit A [Terriglobales bacterium]|nr:F0F1 ATP synthase subunit A [Terriglobales bacterium]